MISFKDFDQEPVTEKEVDDLIESLEWEDIIEIYDESELVLDEAISATERIKMGQKMRSRKALLAMARKVKLKRASSMPVLTRRSKVSARKLIMKKLLKGRDKNSLSAAERNNIEARTTKLMAMAGNLPQKLLPKIKQLERQRLSNKGKQ